MTNPRRRVAPGIWQLKKDLFEIRVRARCPQSGKWKARWRKLEGSKAEALIERERWRGELEAASEHPEPTRETLEVYARSWLSTKLARADIRASTARRYAAALDLHILPALGKVFITELTPRMIERLVSDGVRTYKPATVNGWLRVLRTMLGRAHAQQLVTSNAAAAVQALREHVDDEGDDDLETNALTPEKLGKYLTAWRELYPSDHPVVATLALTGLRWGECTALKWEDVERAEQTGVLRVRRSHVRGVVRGSTKTGRKRTIPFPEALRLLLNDHRHRLIAEQHAGLRDGWVFANDAGKPRANGQLSAKNRRVLAHAGITQRLTIHGLRRTATDLLRRAAVDPVAAKAIIGHATDRMRQHYSSLGFDEAHAIGKAVVALVPGLETQK